MRQYRFAEQFNRPTGVLVGHPGPLTAKDQFGWQDIAIPASYIYVPEGMPKGEPYNVGQMYDLFGQAIRSGQPCQPNFATAVDLHRFIDTVRAASEQGRELAVLAG